MKAVGIVMGSDSDWAVMAEAAQVLEAFGIAYEVKISSAHRTLTRTLAWVGEFERQGGSVVIAAAGLAAHLPGVIAGATTLPVIGVPMRSGALDGLDALYSIVQMPPGVPVATVGIGGARNAGLLAIQMLALTTPSLRQKLAEYRKRMADEIEQKDEALRQKLATSSRDKRGCAAE
ncbi:MAG: 5-(carboxyamino)imidazole ribonucleotide mutase [Peptococcaceae bacterium]|nr:5-(carboxyamino)imidazole ribonucleotide mutase [Peptococcaceae bacterium]